MNKMCKEIGNVAKEKYELYFSKPIELTHEIYYKLPEYEKTEKVSKGDTIKPAYIYNGIEIRGDKWIELACEEAVNSVKHGGGPFGALILQIDSNSGRIIRYWVNHNQVTAANDPTAHAEVMAIRSACKSLGVFNLGEIKKEEAVLPQPGNESYCIIYSSGEPCPMCYSAICWAGLKCLYFAATRFDAAMEGVNFSDEKIYNELALPYKERNIAVYKCKTDKSLDAFNLWKITDKIEY